MKFILAIIFLIIMTTNVFGFNRYTTIREAIYNSSFKNSKSNLSEEQSNTLLKITLRMCSIVQFTPNYLNSNLKNSFLICYNMEKQQRRLSQIPKTNEKLERFIFAHRYASKINLDRKMLVELYNFAIEDPIITLSDTVIMGATARVESRWIPSAISNDGCDLGVFQTRCKSLGDVCEEKYKFKKNGKSCNKDALSVFTTNNVLNSREPISDFHTQMVWFKRHIQVMRKHYKYLKKRINNIHFNKKLSKQYDYKYMVLYPGYADDLYTIRTKRIEAIETYIERYEKGLYLYRKNKINIAKKKFIDKEHFIYSKFTAYRYVKSYNKKRIKY